jgi:RNA polymerase sigma-70 factor (ECF subfamily)
MTDPARHPSQDPVTRRVREAFASLEPSVELDEVVERAARFLRRSVQLGGRDRQGAGRARAGGQPRGRAATVRPELPPSPAGSRLDPAASTPAGRPAAAVAVDCHAATTRRSPGLVTVGGIELAAADLVAARRRDSAAVTRLYQAYAPALLRFFTAAVGDRRAAEDLTGTTLAAAVEALPGFRGELGQLGGWLFRIARHDLYDYRRRVARVRTENLDDVLDQAAAAEDAPDPQDLAIERLDASRVITALHELSVDQREVLLLRLAAGLTVGEVAATLGKTTGAVKALQHRGLASLARKLELPIDHEQCHDHTGPASRPDPPTR